MLINSPDPSAPIYVSMLSLTIGTNPHPKIPLSTPPPPPPLPIHPHPDESNNPPPSSSHRTRFANATHIYGMVCIPPTNIYYRDYTQPGEVKPNIHVHVANRQNKCVTCNLQRERERSWGGGGLALQCLFNIMCSLVVYVYSVLLKVDASLLMAPPVFILF